MNKTTYILSLVILVLAGIVVAQAVKIRSLTHPAKSEMAGVDFTSDISASDTVKTDELITIKMTVANKSLTAINGVIPSDLKPLGTAKVKLILAPSQPADIPAGKKSAFLWKYKATGIGTVVFKGNAEGIQEGTGSPIASVETLSNGSTVFDKKF
jgi:hypothetical protein